MGGYGFSPENEKKTSGEEAKFGKNFVSFPGKAEKIAGKENGVSSWGSFFFSFLCLRTRKGRWKWRELHESLGAFI